MSGKPMQRPTAWRLMAGAFTVWAANFLIGYAAALIAPDHVVTRILLVLLALGSIQPLLWIVRSSNGLAERYMVTAAAVMAALAILFNAAAAAA